MKRDFIISKRPIGKILLWLLAFAVSVGLFTGVFSVFERDIATNPKSAMVRTNVKE